MSWACELLEQVPLQYLLTLIQGCGLVPLAFAAAGLILGWREQRRAILLVVAFPLAYLAFLLPKALFFARFALPLLPFCCLLAALGTVHLVQLARVEWRRALLMVLVPATLAQSLANDFLHDRLLTVRDTRVLAAHWVQDNLPPENRLKMGDYTLQDTSWRHRTNLPTEIEQRIGPLDLSTSNDEVPRADRPAGPVHRHQQLHLRSVGAGRTVRPLRVRTGVRPPLPQPRARRAARRALLARPESRPAFSPGEPLHSLLGPPELRARRPNDQDLRPDPGGER